MKQTTSKTLRAQRDLLKIVPFTEDFITDSYVGWLNDPEVVKYSRQRYSKHTKESSRTFLNHMRPGHFWAILKADTNTHIGNISATVDNENQIADLAILIGQRSVWGQGYGLDAWRAGISLLHDRGMRMVTGGCMASNKAMVRVMEKSGMVPYYTRTGYFLLDGKPVDSIHYVTHSLRADPPEIL